MMPAKEMDPKQLVMGVLLGSDRSIEESFRRFHEENPGVYKTLVAMARQAKEVGRTKLGIGMLWEVLRWEEVLAGAPNDDGGYRLNNIYRSRYARLIMEQEPDLEGFFETRRLSAK